MHVMSARGPSTYVVEAGLLDELREDRALLVREIESLMSEGTTPGIEPLCEFCRASTVRGETHSAHCRGLRILVAAHAIRCPTCEGAGVLAMGGAEGLVTLCPTCSARVTVP